MMKPLQQIDYLTRELALEYPDHRLEEIETAVLLAALEMDGMDDRGGVRRVARTLLSDGGIATARAIAEVYGVQRHKPEPAEPAGVVTC